MYESKALSMMYVGAEVEQAHLTNFDIDCLTLGFIVYVLACVLTHIPRLV